MRIRELSLNQPLKKKISMAINRRCDKPPLFPKHNALQQIHLIKTPYLASESVYVQTGDREKREGE
jgi:hypothetical protein